MAYLAVGPSQESGNTNNPHLVSDTLVVAVSLNDLYSHWREGFSGI